MKKDVQKSKLSSEEKKIKGSFRSHFANLSRKKKILVIVSSSILLLAAILAAVWFIFFQGQEEPSDAIFYYPASESENIFENDAYLSFDRDLRYAYGGVEQLYNYEADYESGDAYCKFFLDYFKTLTEGDGKKLAEFYVDNFFETIPDITMQMVYEPYVYFHSEGTAEVDGEEIEVANFEVRYKIFKNNGSFRKGVASNQAVPQVYQLTVQDGSIKILDVLEVVYE